MKSVVSVTVAIFLGLTFGIIVAYGIMAKMDIVSISKFYEKLGMQSWQYHLPELTRIDGIVVSRDDRDTLSIRPGSPKELSDGVILRIRTDADTSFTFKKGVSSVSEIPEGSRIFAFVERHGGELRAASLVLFDL